MTREALREHQARRLQDLLRRIYPSNAFYRRKLNAAGFDPGCLDADPASGSRLLEALPITTREEILEDQREHPPYGTNLTYPRERYTRQHQTSGTMGVPLRWLDTRESWQCFLDCWKEVYRGMKLRPDDRLCFPFSFGPFIGFWGGFEAACQLGNFSLPGGGMTTVARLRSVIENDISVVVCTPTYALRMAEVAAAEGIAVKDSRVRALVVAGEPGGSIDATRSRTEEGWGARVYDHCGMTEAGAVGFECHENPGGLHVVEREFIAEVLEPEGERPAAPGARGELVLTSLGRPGSPVIRYRTGDLVLWSEDPCPCGRPEGRLAGGILGRVDDKIFVRGNTVYPGAIEAVVRSFPEVAEYRVRVLESDGMADLLLELDPVPDLDESGRAQLVDRVARSLRDTLYFRATVTLVPAGSLPRFDMKARRIVRESIVREERRE